MSLAGYSRLLTTLAAAFTIALAGCSSNGDNNPGTQESTPAPEPSPKEFVPASSDGPAQNVPKPEFTSKTQELTEEDAEAALRHWNALADYATLTGDTTVLSEWSHTDCESCRAVIDGYNQVYSDGSWIAFKDDSLAVPATKITVTDFEIREEDNEIVLTFDVVEPAMTLYNPDGSVNTDASLENPATVEAVAGLRLDPRYRKWQMMGFGEASYDD